MNVTKHFSVAELTTTSTGLPNYPAQSSVWCNLTRLCCDVLEPLRDVVGAIRVNSGYRSKDVNSAVGGSERSAHLYGRAADLVPWNDKENALNLMRTLQSSLIEFDKAILEHRGKGLWLHVQVRDVTREARCICLMSLEAGEYIPFDENDERLDRWK